MRTVPSYARQTEVWADLLSTLGFKQVIFIHSSDQEGRAMLGKFQSKTESENRKVGCLRVVYSCLWSFLSRESVAGSARTVLLSCDCA